MLIEKCIVFYLNTWKIEEKKFASLESYIRLKSLTFFLRASGWNVLIYQHQTIVLLCKLSRLHWYAKSQISRLFKNYILSFENFFATFLSFLGDGLRCGPLQAVEHQRLVLGLHPRQDAAHQPARRRHPRPWGQRVGGHRSQGTAPAGRVHARGRPRGGALHGRHWRQVAWHELSWAPAGRLRGFAPDQYSVCEEQQPWPPDPLEIPKPTSGYLRDPTSNLLPPSLPRNMRLAFTSPYRPASSYCRETDNRPPNTLILPVASY